MIFLLKHTRDVAFLSGVVYFMQGFLGISGIALPLFMRNLHWTISEITTFSSIAAVPWVLKILYGLVSDTYPVAGYRRKSYLIIFSLVAASGWLGLVLLPSEKHWIILSLGTANLGFAATDVITDGLIVEHSTSFTSTVYQAIAWGSRSLGSILSGVLSGWLAKHWEPQNVFLLTMLLPLGVLLSALLIHEKKYAKPPFHSAFAPAKRCLKLMLNRQMACFTAILFTVSISSSIATPFFFFMKESLGFDETFLGFLASLAWSGAMLGSLLYIRWLRHIPVKKTLRWAVLINSLNILSTLFITDHKSAFFLVFVGGVMGCLVMLPVMSSAAAMTHNSGVEGTLFAVLMSIFNLGQIVSGILGGKIYQHVGLYPLIGLIGWISLLGAVFVEKLDLKPAASSEGAFP